MLKLIEHTIARNRSIILILILILISGTTAYINIPKESSPDINIPNIYVSIHHEGISAEDSERLLVRPMEKELRSVEGLKEMRATAMESHANLMLEFEAGFDSDQALTDIREKVDIAKAKLPANTDEPFVGEINFALFPIVVITLSGDVSETALVQTARRLRDEIESLPNVLEANIGGDREELVEILIDPLRLEGYNLSQREIFSFVAQNNQLIAAGALDTGQGRFSVKVPGVFDSVEDVLNLPIKVEGDSVIKFRDVATGRRTFKDPTSFVRINGKPAITLEISKRIGANVIETIDSVKALIEIAKPRLPEGINVNYSQDQSKMIKTMLLDLQNNVIIAVLLVSVVLIASLGLRAALLVGVAIPGSFLTGILVLATFGYTINMIVLFSLIMAVGMLVDGAIVVVELADRKMAENFSRKEAFTIAAKRMAWPIIASTATTLAAFAPLLFWPGMVGEFMKYLPITLIATLAASLLMALIFVPTVGSLVGKRAPDSQRHTEALGIAEYGDLDQLKGSTGVYLSILKPSLKHPVIVFSLAVLFLVGTVTMYGIFGKGVEFFPEVEPEIAMVKIHARGDLSVFQRDALVREVETRVLDIEGFKTVYTRSGTNLSGQNLKEDVIGVIQLELRDWQHRKKASRILDEIRRRTSDLAGLVIEVEKQEEGPPTGKPIHIEISSHDPDLLEPTIIKLRNGFEEIGGLLDITDSRPIPGIEWQIEVDKVQASLFGMDIATVGTAIQLITNGIKVGEYRPDDTEDEIDIRVRFPANDRSIDQLYALRVPTPQGAVPISNFVKRIAAQKVSKIERSDATRIMSIEANLPDGVLVDSKIKEIDKWRETAGISPEVKLTYKGEDEEQKKAKDFLSKAFIVALFIMAIILVTQFNSIYQAILILTAVIFSTIGVFLGLLITNQPFGIVMTGIGVIALAGIVVNNNIVLIDTFNHLRQSGMEIVEAAMRTGAQRLRPVMLTTITTILGLMPMVLSLNIDLINRKITFGAPSAQWWTQLSTAVAGGLAFATILTLIVTPAMIVIGERYRKIIRIIGAILIALIVLSVIGSAIQMMLAQP